MRFRDAEEEYTSPLDRTPFHPSRPTDLPEKQAIDPQFSTKQVDETELEPVIRNVPIVLVEDNDDSAIYDELNDYKQNDDESMRAVIHVFPTDETYKGTEPEAVLLRWHLRSGHINPQYLLRVCRRAKGMEELNRLQGKRKIRLPGCDACFRGKSKARKPIKTKSHRYREVLYRLHTDMSGKISTRTLQGAQYFCVFVDDASGYKFVTLLKNKSDFIKEFDRLCIRLGRHPRILRCDNAGEMIGGEAQEYYKKYSIWREACSPHEHAQNPRAESAICSLSMRARTIMLYANAPKHLWGFAVQYAAELENRFCPFMKGSDITCYEAFHGSLPDNDFIGNAQFGCRAYLHVDKARRKDGKWDETAVPCVFLGTAMHMGHKAFLLGTEDCRRIFVAHHNVTIDETKFPWRKVNTREEPVKIVHGQELETVPDVDNPTTSTASAIEAPTYIYDADFASDASVDYSAELADRVRTRSMARAIPTEQECQQRVAAENQALADIEDAEERQQAARQPLSEPQDPFERAHRMADQLLEDIQNKIASRSGGGSANFAQLEPEPDHVDVWSMLTRGVHNQNNHAWSRRSDSGARSRRSNEPLLWAAITFNEEPKTYPEAIARKHDCDKWHAATYEELNQWFVLKVYEVVDEPEDEEIIESRTVYKVKLDEFNNPYHWKCRIVARGFQESDPGETFAPMAHPTTIRTIIAIACANGWMIKQADIKTAYLNAKLPKPIYMRPPVGLEVGKGKVWKIHRATYGLGATGRLWWQLFAKKNKEFGMEPVTTDDCAFICRRSDKVLVIAIVVDDILQTGNSEELRLEWLNFMREFFTVSDDGEL